MNPTDQPPSAEAVKAAFAYVDGVELSFHDLQKHRIYADNSTEDCAARILAAHARAKEAEVARLTEALETVRDRGHQYGTALTNSLRHVIDKALTGEASAS